MMQNISEEERLILLWKYQDDYTIKDIQSILDISESAVKMRIKRAKQKLYYQHIKTKERGEYEP
ncbi:MAG: sigma-70 region 4 domain-containing protein [Bacteroidota bacterium]|nr:sigma-70 region 4 domain-containing protein [Bacteroidota bacterium]